jgi:hypothetical protein
VKLFGGVCAALLAYTVVMALGLASALGGSQVQSGAFPVGTDLGLSPEQVRNATISLTVADDLNAPPLAVLAMMVGALGESDLTVVANHEGSGYCGVYQADPDNIACDDTEQQAKSFLQGGLGFNGGGGIALAVAHPDWTPGHVAFVVEGDLRNFGGDQARAAAFYDVHRAKAERIVAAWRSGGSVADADSGGGDVLDRLEREADRMTSLHQPYLWGGGHRGFDSHGPWDCSGAVSWLLHYLGMLDGFPLDSTHLMAWGQPGRGRDFTVWANMGHVFIIIEGGSRKGQAWGTATSDLAGRPGSGPLWHHHGTSGFVPRHFAGH